MTETHHPIPKAQSPFDAAKVIVETLQGLEHATQILALKFASETLGLAVSAVGQATGSVNASQLAAKHEASQQTPPSADIKQFTLAKAPKSDQQFAAVAAYFYQFEAPATHRKNSVNADTMKEAARHAGWPQVTNWKATLYNAKNSGFLDSVGNGDFQLNAVGENLVAMTLPGTGTAGATTNKVTKKKSARARASGRKPSKRG